jgi:hypothetical protein
MAEKWSPIALHWSWGDQRWSPEEERRAVAAWLRVLAALSFLIAFQTEEGRVVRFRVETMDFHLSFLDWRRAVLSWRVACLRLCLAAMKDGFVES